MSLVAPQPVEVAPAEDTQPRPVDRQQRVDLKPLTSLRFVAALLVFFTHTLATHAVATAWLLGAAGVNFFFQLSGFILTYSYGHVFADGLRSESLRAFYVARFARIYPVYLVTLVIGAVAATSFTAMHWAELDSGTRILSLAAHVVAVQSWIPNADVYLGINGPSWSIADEALFYALLPIIVLLAMRLTRRQALATACLLAAAYAVAVMIGRPTPSSWAWTILPVSRLPDFVFGSLLGVAFLRRENEPAMRAATLLEVGAIAALGLAILCVPFVPEPLRISPFLMPFWGALISVFAYQRGHMSRTLSHPLAIRLGEASFAFYLVQESVLLLTSRASNWSLSPWLILPSLIIALGVAESIHRFIERPMRDGIRAALRGHTKRRSGIAAAEGTALS